ncbi:capsule assembly Wzi family protein [Pseudoalteromonas sp. B62]|uniref:capsule assembly Wzi family protein n=1 Tax=Pseudoalteromonas sp. B62 TaxID=630483 RepID=UPI00301D4BB3
MPKPFLPGGNDNVNAEEIQKYGPNYEVGDQLASLSFDYKATWFDMPFSLYGDMGLEDTLGGTRNNSYNFGLYLPYLIENNSLRLENSRWQTEWYWSKLYSQGNTIDKQALGHWGAEQRYFQHYPSAESQSVNWVWQYSATQNIDTTFRRIETEMDSNGKIGSADAPYSIGFELETRYTQQLQDGYWGLELYTGKTVFDDNFLGLVLFMDGKNNHVINDSISRH